MLIIEALHFVIATDKMEMFLKIKAYIRNKKKHEPSLTKTKADSFH